MQYEIYLDKLFLINFMFNSLVLFITKTFLKIQTRAFRLWLSAIVGSLGFCLVFVLPIPAGTGRVLCLFLAVYPLMIAVLCWQNSRRKKIQCAILTGMVALLLGKLLEYVYYFMYKVFRKGSMEMIMLLGIGVSGFLYCLGRIYIGLCEEETKYYTVQIIYGSRSVVVSALYDTGNLLRDPVTGRCVHIVDKETVRRLGVLGDKHMEDTCGIRLIPYRTIANSGLIPVFPITQMKISNEKSNYVILNPLLGISSENFSSNQKYHMILNAGELN